MRIPADPADRSKSPRETVAAITIAVALLAVSCGPKERGAGAEDFVSLMNTGKNYYDKGEAAKAIPAFERALQLQPAHPDVHLNLANAYLLADQPTNALRHAQQALQLEPNSGAAHYLAGCAYLRLRQPQEAVKELQTAKQIDKTVNAVSFQLGRAHQELGQFEDARAQFEEVLTFEPDHPAANYNLSQVLLRLGLADEAKAALDRHQALLAQRQGPAVTPALLERCRYTEARAPFKPELPDRQGVPVVFAEATAAAFGDRAAAYRGPFGILPINHRGWNDLFVREGEDGFRVLFNTNGVFQPLGERLAGTNGAGYAACLVGDLNNDRIEDVIVLGTHRSHVFRFATNGVGRDITRATGLTSLQASGGLLADVDFTGWLGLLTLTPSNGVQVFRNLGNSYFKDITATSGVPASVTGARQVLMDDWNNDDLLDLFIAREDQPPLLLSKVRGGPLALTNTPAPWPSGAAIAVGDLNNDLRHDLAVATASEIVIAFNQLTNQARVPLAGFAVRRLELVDYDNDGWLDLVAIGDGLRVWRNLGPDGFEDRTASLALDTLPRVAIEHFAAADFDNDGDLDLLLGVASGGLKLLRNDGGNANHLLKLRLLGNRSNASGLGIRVELAAGGFRALRTVRSLPVEIGVGRHAQLESLTVHWFDLMLNSADVQVDPHAPVALMELSIPTGSCPYLYAWDGERFRFVTDLLGAAPLGLPVAEGRFIEADPEEFVWIGGEERFRPRAGAYVLQITEELREVLYLDTARLVVVDHPAGTEVHPTSKLLPGRPFEPHELVTLRARRPLLHASQEPLVDTANSPATDSSARSILAVPRDVTSALAEQDGAVVSPFALREPQLRGLAEPYRLTLDFGPLEPELRPQRAGAQPEQEPAADRTSRPSTAHDPSWVLALTGWLRFGGGMANIAAAHQPHLPFPFPTLEAETPDGSWTPLDVRVGAPAGKTKTILVDLAGKLPPGARRLRLTTAFEIHWDRIALFERAPAAGTRIVALSPSTTDLHWRGFSQYEDLPWYVPLTPDYDRVRSAPPWRITPAGWCTRYGAVDDLLAARDDALVLLNGGDELTLCFAADRLPPKPAGSVRDFFLYTVGWDKDADVHVAHGTTVEPLPFHGLDDQRYGTQPRPPAANADWIEKYNTRWVGPRTIARRDHAAVQ
jgi:Tfp pilus assembly protein PilF